MNVSVISREFLNDTNAQSLTDLFRYTAAAAGDTRFAMRIPANSATPQGTFTMRGFVVNSLMRNGIFRYTSYNLDTVERGHRRGSVKAAPPDQGKNRLKPALKATYFASNPTMVLFSELPIPVKFPDPRK